MWLAQSEECHWWWPFEQMIVYSERHSVLNINKEGRLHCETGPAMAYPDGFAVYAINGMRLPKYVIENPQDITVSDIDNEANAEIKRVKIEKYGTSRYLLDSGAKIIHEYNGHVPGLKGGKLYLKQILNDEPICMVGVYDSTPENGQQRQYFFEVPPDMKTVEQAVAWQYGMTADEYLPKLES
jgi:hypothetical protein